MRRSPLEHSTTIVRPFVRLFPRLISDSLSISALVVAYAYHPNAQTLFDAYLKPKPPTFHQGRLQPQVTAIPEKTLWSYIVQIAGAVKQVHDAGCAMRMIDATKVLVTG